MNISTEYFDCTIECATYPGMTDFTDTLDHLQEDQIHCNVEKLEETTVIKCTGRFYLMNPVQQSFTEVLKTDITATAKNTAADHPDHYVHAIHSALREAEGLFHQHCMTTIGKTIKITLPSTEFLKMTLNQEV
ncbi:hypothetical protein BH11BAC2_BH11BAC2_04080 [soil metagenome]